MDGYVSFYSKTDLKKKEEANKLLTKKGISKKLNLEKQLIKIKRKYWIKVEKNIYIYEDSQLNSLGFLWHRYSWYFFNRTEKYFVALSNSLINNYSEEALLTVLCHELNHVKESSSSFILNMIEIFFGDLVHKFFHRWIELNCDIFSFKVIEKEYWEDYALKGKGDFFWSFNLQKKHNTLLKKSKRTHPLDTTRMFVKEITIKNILNGFL